MSTSTDAQPAKAADSSKAVASSAADKPKLSGAELKKQKQAEKAARRAKVIEKKAEAGVPGIPVGGSIPKGKEHGTSVESIQKEKEHIQTKTKTTSVDTAKRGKVEQEGTPHNKLPFSYAVPSGKNKRIGGAHPSYSLPQSVPSKDKKHTTPFWGQSLQDRQDRMSTTQNTMMKNIHLEVRALGLKIEHYDVMGSNARLVGMLNAFKNVIQDYKTPENQALSRHLISPVLNAQIEHIASCRPLSVSQGNAIRWLKLEISKIDVITPEDEAKEFLCTGITNYIRDKSTLAHQVIAELAAQKIKDGDVVLTYAKSVVVEKTIKKAWNDGKRFRIIIIDSNPWFEGKKLSESLVADPNLKEMRISLGAHNSVSHYIDQATKVLLGAHAMMSNGYLYSRVGTMGIAIEAHDVKVPVIVLCESVKFSDKAPLTSYEMNELAPTAEMIPARDDRMVRSMQDVEGLKSVNLMYDLTRAEWISMVISEHGAVPPTSVPILNRLHNGAEEDQ